MVKRLREGVACEVAGAPATLTLLSLHNAFAAKFAHPTHMRHVSIQSLVCHRGVCVAVNIEVEHERLRDHYDEMNFVRRNDYILMTSDDVSFDDVAECLPHQVRHYDYFFDRVLSMTPSQFNEKFELLLIFLVEAIGVPVLLSLLLLTYSSSSSGSATIDLDELPQDRLQLYVEWRRMASDGR